MKYPLKALYMYVNEEGLELILTNGMLKASVTASVNDPMENLPAVTDSTHQTKAFSVQDGGKPYFCFSESMSNPQLWGQYAQEGRGACLVFLFPLQQRSSKYNKADNAPRAWKWAMDPKARKKTVANKVPNYWQALDYKEERVCLSEKSDTTECIFSKGKDWSYEQEVRCCCDQMEADEAKANNLLYKWPLQFLAGVILGRQTKYSVAYVQRKLNGKTERKEKSEESDTEESDTEEAAATGSTPSPKPKDSNEHSAPIAANNWLKMQGILPWLLATRNMYHNTKFEYFSAPWFDCMEGYDAYVSIGIACKIGILKLPENSLIPSGNKPQSNHTWPQWSKCIKNVLCNGETPPKSKAEYKKWLDRTYQQICRELEL